jgi:hypothetical protein
MNLVRYLSHKGVITDIEVILALGIITAIFIWEMVL